MNIIHEIIYTVILQILEGQMSLTGKPMTTTCKYWSFMQSRHSVNRTVHLRPHSGGVRDTT